MGSLEYEFDLYWNSASAFLAAHSAGVDGAAVDMVLAARFAAV